MSLEEFEKIYSNRDSRCNIIIQYIKKNETVLRNINDNSVYGVILRTYLHTNMKYFVDSKYEWTYIEYRYFEDYCWKDVILQPSDLSDERMTGMTNDFFYVTLLKMFLIYHEIEEIPQSFIDRVDRRNNDCYVLSDLCFAITGENTSFFKTVINKTFKNKKLIQMMSHYLPFYDEELRNDTVPYSINKNKIFMTLVRIFESYLNTEDDEDDDLYLYKSKIVTEDNIIEIIFDIIKNEKYHGNIIALSNYFEYMKLDEQMMFWNMINTEDTYVLCDMINTEDTYGLCDVVLSSDSEIFIEYAFDNYSEFNNQNNICNIICSNGHHSDIFVKIFIKKFPDISNTIFMYELLLDPTLCYRMFPNLSLEEMIGIINQYVATIKN